MWPTVRLRSRMQCRPLDRFSPLYTEKLRSCCGNDPGGPHGIGDSSFSSFRVAPRALRRLRRPLCAGDADGGAAGTRARVRSAKADAAFQPELDLLLKDFAGRPTPLYFAKRLTEDLGGAKIYLKREDLLHTGAHKINNALGQGLLARRMGKQRIIAETGAGQHGVATATVCALLGMECVIYMGDVDMARQELNVLRMRLLGAEVRGVSSGSKTLKDAISEAMRDWVTNVRTTHYLLGSALGAHPYPTMVRDFQRCISREMKAQILEKEGRLPTAVIACVGGGSNAIGAFYELSLTARCALSASRRAAAEPRLASTLRVSAAALPACFRAHTRMSCRMRTGRSRRRIPSPRDLTTLLSGPSTPRCTTRAAPSTFRRTMRRRSMPW